MHSGAPGTAPPRDDMWGTARFWFVSCVVPVAAVLGLGFAASAARVHFVGVDAPYTGSTLTVISVGWYATIAAMGFARSTRGLTIERMRYRAVPMTVAGAFLCAATVSGGTPADASALVAIPLLVVGAAIGAACGLATARVICPTQHLPSSQSTAPAWLERATLARGRTAVWSGRLARLSPRAVVRFPVGFAAWFLLVGHRSPASTVAVAITVTTVLAGLWTWDWRATLTIGGNGLEIRSGIGGRRWHAIAIDNMVGARTVTAHRQLFWRSPQWTVPGQIGFVTSSGPAMLARLTDGTQLVVRIDHADEAASVLNSLLDRRADCGNAAAC